jgi:hypothetical protein
MNAAVRPAASRSAHAGCSSTYQAQSLSGHPVRQRLRNAFDAYRIARVDTLFLCNGHPRRESAGYRMPECDALDLHVDVGSVASAREREFQVLNRLARPQSLNRTQSSVRN